MADDNSFSRTRACDPWKRIDNDRDNARYLRASHRHVRPRSSNRRFAKYSRNECLPARECPARILRTITCNAIGDLSSREKRSIQTNDAHSVYLSSSPSLSPWALQKQDPFHSASLLIVSMDIISSDERVNSKSPMISISMSDDRSVNVWSERSGAKAFMSSSSLTGRPMLPMRDSSARRESSRMIPVVPVVVVVGTDVITDDCGISIVVGATAFIIMGSRLMLKFICRTAEVKFVWQ